MNRNELISTICPAYYKDNCANQVDCSYCKETLNRWLDEYDKHIRAEAFNEAFEIVLSEENQVVNFADRVGISILKKIKENS